MSHVKLKFDGREFLLGSGIATLGRTPDNSVAFPDDANVSRYHAEIENRDGEYCLIDLNSSNGTAVNGQPVNGEVYLADGDRIVLGNSAELVVEFAREGVSSADTNAAVNPANSGTSAAGAAAGAADDASAVNSAVSSPVSSTEANSGTSRKMLFAAGGVFGLAVIFAVAAGAIYFSGDSACDASAIVLFPEPGETIEKPTDVEIEMTNGECVGRVIFTLDEIEFASSTTPPFSISIDPAEFPDLADGFDHPLGVILEDEKGQRLPQSEAVLVAFETRAISKPPTDVAGTNGDTTGQTGQTGRSIQTGDGAAKPASLIEIHEMAKRLIRQFPGGERYNISNRQLLQEVQRKTAEYALGGYYERAAKYRDAINVAYVKEQNLDAPLGFMLAMSRSGFEPAISRGNAANSAQNNPGSPGGNAGSSKITGSSEGLWRMTNEFVASNGYNGLCGTETLSDPAQNCAAKASAIYMKALITGVFDGDVLYAVAAFGKSTTQAGEWKASLPANRMDIWNSIKTSPEREQVVRFLAAGIVAENPQKFGMEKDRPLSELYRIAL